MNSFDFDMTSDDERPRRRRRDEYGNLPRKRRPVTLRMFLGLGMLTFAFLTCGLCLTPFMPRHPEEPARAVAPIASKPAEADDDKRPTAVQGVPTTAKPHREKTEHVSGYTTKTGKVVAPYVRRSGQ